MTAENPRNPLPGVPAAESPFRERLFEQADAETRRLARALGDDGFAVIEFPDRDFDSVAEEIKRDLRERSGAGAWGPGVRFANAWRFNAEVKRIACNMQVLALLSRLYGRRAWPFQTLNFPFGSEQHFHSDAVHFSSVPERFMCGVWVALEDVDADTGPLVYYPGSHKWPIYTGEHLGVPVSDAERIPGQGSFEPLWRALVAEAGLRPAYFTPRKGEALIWAANLLHGGSARRRAGATRWSQVTHYYFDDCAYYTPMLSDPFHGRIRFRDEVDISTGRPMPSSYLGRPVPEEFIAATAPPPAAPARLPDGFDPASYYEANPDVKLAGMPAGEHWLLYGRAEGRRLRPE